MKKYFDIKYLILAIESKKEISIETLRMSLKLVKGVLNLPKKDLNLRICLRGGMSFRWSLLNDSESKTEFVGVIKNRIYFLSQNEATNFIEYKVYTKENEPKETLGTGILNELNGYFRLGENLNELYIEWSKRDPKFKEKVDLYPDVLEGIRSLRIDPVENLFSFICSSNNNIKRITMMVANMCKHFGNLIGQVNGIDYYSFPNIDRLAKDDVEKRLRALNFGYRAKFINQAAVYIKNNHDSEIWLESLRQKPYDEVTQSLIKIPGIGKKVMRLIKVYFNKKGSITC